MADPIVKVWPEIDANEVSRININIQSDWLGHLLLVVDLSDSAGFQKPDIEPLLKILKALPHDWQATVMGMGGTVDFGRNDATVGNLVDPSFELGAVFADPMTIQSERKRGSFLGPALKKFLGSAHANGKMLFALVATDGKLLDIDPIRLPEGVQAIGLALGSDISGRSRWEEVVPGIPLIGRNFGDEVAKKISADISRHSSRSCNLVIPSLDCHLPTGASPEAKVSRGDADTTITWDYVKNPCLVVEFPSNQFPGYVEVEPAGTARNRIAIKNLHAKPSKPDEPASPTPTVVDAAKAMPVEGQVDNNPARFLDQNGLGPDEPLSTSPTAVQAAKVVMPEERVGSILKKARLLSDSAMAGKTNNNKPIKEELNHEIASNLNEDSFESSPDAFLLLINNNIGDSEKDENEFFISGLQRSAKFDISSGSMILNGHKLLGGKPWSLHFDQQKNGWVLSLDGMAFPRLEELYCQELNVQMKDIEDNEWAFFLIGSPDD